MYKNIYELVRNKKIVLSAEAAMELADEAMDDVPDEVEGEVTKIQTIDILAQVMNKFDTYMNDTELNFNFFINNGRIDKAVNFNTLEDLHTLLNKTFDEKEFISVKDFNDLYALMTNVDFCRSLALYGRENYEKPFIAEGLAVLLYEFAVDFTTLLTRYYKDMPTISNEVGEADSFFRKFPSLILNSYITNMIVNSKEFNQLLTNEESKREARNIIDSYIYNRYIYKAIESYINDNSNIDSYRDNEGLIDLVSGMVKNK